MGQAKRIKYTFGGYSIKHRLLTISLISTLMPILLLLYIRYDIMPHSPGAVFTAKDIQTVDGILVGGSLLTIAGLLLMHSITNRLVSLIRTLRYGVRFDRQTDYDDLQMVEMEVARLRDTFNHQKSDIGKLKKQNEALEQEFESMRSSQGMVKPLPRVDGHWDERGWQACLAQEVERSRRYRKQFSIFFMEIDGLRETVRDLPYGERAGFKRMVKNRIAGYLRLSDLITGEPLQYMVLLLPETNAHGCARAARRIWASFSEEVFMPWKARHGLSFNSHIGCATYPADATDAPTLIERAREALTHAGGMTFEPRVAVFNRGDIGTNVPEDAGFEDFRISGSRIT